jgi:hypothetical protein
MEALGHVEVARRALAELIERPPRGIREIWYALVVEIEGAVAGWAAEHGYAPPSRMAINSGLRGYPAGRGTRGGMPCWNGFRLKPGTYTPYTG